MIYDADISINDAGTFYVAIELKGRKTSLRNHNGGTESAVKSRAITHFYSQTKYDTRGSAFRHTGEIVIGDIAFTHRIEIEGTDYIV